MRHFGTYLGVVGLLGSLTGASFAASPTPVDCDPITGCPAAVASGSYDSRAAYIFNNGHTTATVVPSLGRVMQFGLNSKSTFNWLWNNLSPNPKQTWKNWGGHKTWLAPQDNWEEWSGARWPPDAAWTKIVKSEVQSGGFLQTTSALSPTSGIRLIHQYGHDATGSFFIRQTAEKVSGKPVEMALWSVTQITPPEAIFFVLDKGDTVSDAWKPLQGTADSNVDSHGNIACYYPSTTQSLKVGLKTSTPVLAAFSKGQLFVLRATPQEATYPDGRPSRPGGFSIEIFDTGSRANPYIELEMLSPLRQAWMGSRWTFTVRWDVYQLKSSKINSPELWEEVAVILDAE